MAGIELKDVVLLILSFGLGIAASMAAALILGPVMTILCGFHTIKLLSRLRQLVGFGRGDLFSKPWTQSWSVKSDRFPTDNPSALTLYRVSHLLAGEATMKTAAGTVIGYRLVGVMDGNRITGKWMDPETGGYYGAFQLILSHTRDGAEGLWIGFSTAGIVKSGQWSWRLADAKVPAADPAPTAISAKAS